MIPIPLPKDLRPTPADREWLEDIVFRLEQRYQITVGLPAAAGEPLEPERLAYWRLYAVLKEVLGKQTLDDKLIEAMMPETIPSESAVIQAQQNARLRSAFLAQYGLRGEDVAALGGSRAENRAALASRWYAESRLLRVEHNGIAYYPSFQFDDQGKPRPIMRNLLGARAPAWSDWEFALWFTASNGWLSGQHPLELLDKNPKAVLAAATHQARELAF